MSSTKAQSAVRPDRSRAAPAARRLPVCPSTGETLSDPVILTDGQSVERSAVERYLRRTVKKHKKRVRAAKQAYRDQWTIDRVAADGDVSELGDDPITCDPLTDPHVASDGRTYNRTTVEDLITKGDGRSPFTREPLQPMLIRHLGARRALGLPSDATAPRTLDLSRLIARQQRRSASRHNPMEDTAVEVGARLGFLGGASGGIAGGVAAAAALGGATTIGAIVGTVGVLVAGPFGLMLGAAAGVGAYRAARRSRRFAGRAARGLRATGHGAMTGVRRVGRAMRRPFRSRVAPGGAAPAVAGT